MKNYISEIAQCAMQCCRTPKFLSASGVPLITKQHEHLPGEDGQRSFLPWNKDPGLGS